MQYHWLNKQNNDNLVVFFAGWSFDYIPFEFLECGNNDVVVIFDYNNLEGLPLFSNYKTKTLITWSMGVYIAYLLKDKLPNFDKKIAINGTVYPIDDKFGIPEKTFNLTLKYAETGLRGKFYQNVFNSSDLYERYMQNPVARPLKNRVDELSALYDLIKNTQIKYDGKYYTKAIVSLSDKIIPSKNQLAFWGKIAEPIECGHFPFYNYKSWDELCK